MAAPALPKKIWIGTHEVPVKMTPPKDDVFKPDKEDEEWARGISFLEDPPCIHISEGMSLTQQFEVVYHEIEHVMNWVHDIEDETTEEDSTDVHGKAWTTLLVANPKFARWVYWIGNAIRKERTK
jgi:hypothetical protein